MPSATALLRTLARRLVPLLALLTLVAPFAAGTHDHEDAGDHVCAVCSVGHAPAVAAEVRSAPAAPDAGAGPLQPHALAAPGEVLRAATPSRAPPCP